MLPVTIRAATVEDIPFLRKMIWEAVLASPTLLAQLGEEAIRRHEEHYWQNWSQDPDPAFVALDSAEHELGALTLQANDQQEPVIGWRIGLGVEADARGQGVGRRMVER